MRTVDEVPSRFRAVYVAEPDGTPARHVDISESDLDDGDVLIKVQYSSLNYKDGLALTGSGRVVRKFPMVGGIDLVGQVVRVEGGDFEVGQAVVVTGWGMGEEHSGGYSHYAKVPAQWCQPLPDGLSTLDAITVGTAGLTAMLSILALERNGSAPDEIGDLPLVVTGASGGVGSLAVLLASRVGYRVTASTGRVSESAYLAELGAIEVIDRAELAEMGRQPLAKVRFGAGIDSVGGPTLANLLACTRPDGTVAACGLAGGVDLPTTVHPFILRGVTLAGVNSVRPPRDDRSRAWSRIAETCGDNVLATVGSVEPMSRLLEVAPSILEGTVRGRMVIDVDR